MEAKAVVQARARLAMARAAVERVARATDFEEMKANWTVFLTSSHGIYNKLDRGAGRSGTSRAWMEAKKAERERDPLLKYIHVARSADEHDIVELTEEAFSQVTVSGTGTFVDTTNGAGAEIVVDKFRGRPFAFRREHLRLEPAPQGRGKQPIDPPTTHLGQPIVNGSAFAVGRVVVSYLDAMVREAEQLAEASPPTAAPS